MLQLAGRRGAGRLQQVEVRLLALQHWREDSRARLAKVSTKENVADVLTKRVTREAWQALSERSGLRTWRT